MSFDYSLLLAKITTVFGTQAKFAEAMDLSERSISLKLNHKVRWKDTEIKKAVDLLGIPVDEVPIYFFKLKVQSIEQS